MCQLLTWSIPSQNGWDRIDFEFQCLHEGLEWLEFHVNLAGRSWYEPATRETPRKYVLADVYSIKLLTVLISQNASYKLLEHFNQWLDSRSPFRCDLSPLSYELVSLELAIVGTTSTSADTPQLTFGYGVVACRTEVSFVVDQSCIRMARDSLYRVLSLLDD